MLQPHYKHHDLLTGPGRSKMDLLMSIHKNHVASVTNHELELLLPLSACLMYMGKWSKYGSLRLFRLRKALKKQK
jgi:hypothetical protein